MFDNLNKREQLLMEMLDIAIGAMISMLCGDYIIAWYLGF